MPSHSTKILSGLSRRRLIGGTLAAVALLPAGTPARARAVEVSEGPDDQRFMRMALEEAALGDYPFGAAITRDGEVLVRARNIGKLTQDPTAHAEMIAIRRFLNLYGPEELKGTTIYASGEPCPMCMGAIIWCGIGRVVFGASIEQLATKIGQIMVSSADLAANTPFETIAITGGVLAEQSLKLFK
ncbi:MAG: nucleoside deaminase [Methyloceanibacter sp.]|uniref:nucleoside deaminase n=1 Tax=Methyloceanibacter sp. TaxID=1965321 RepID=UPI003D6CC728